MNRYISFGTVAVLSVAIIAGTAQFVDEPDASDLKRSWIPYEAVLCYPVEKPRSCYFYVESKHFENRKDMESLARHFSIWVPDSKRGVNFYLYDNRDDIRTHFNSDIMGGFFKYGRGRYVRGKEMEFLLYHPDKSNKDRYAKIVLMDVKKKKGA